MFEIFNKFFSNDTNIPSTPKHKNSNIYIDADGDFDQELLQNMLEYAKNKKDYGNHILVIENNIEKLKLKVK
jgi:hypothetical protein